MGKRGPQPMGFDVELRTRITPELDTNLDRMADVVGVSKATLVRVALTELVGEYQERVQPTRTTGLNRRRRQ
jgi:hypothetical protein